MPYIDVMLVLLIIFMVTAPLLNLGVDIELPQSQRQGAERSPRIRSWSASTPTARFALKLPDAAQPSA